MSKTVSSNLQSHLEGDVTTLTSGWKIVRTDSVEEFYTVLDTTFEYDGDTYSPVSTSFSPTAIKTTGDLSVDNLELEVLLGGVDRDDILAGVYDFAEIYFFLINYKSPADGVIKLRRGKFGEVTLQRGKIDAELMGMTSVLQHQMMEVTSPTCRADLGDSRCGVSLASHKVTGTTDDVVSNEDFADHPTGSGVPSGFTRRLAGVDSNWAVNTDVWQSASNQIGGKIVEGDFDNGWNYPANGKFSMLDCDFAAGYADVHMICKIAPGTKDEYTSGIAARMSGTPNSETGYLFGFWRHNTSVYLRLSKMSAGSETSLGSMWSSYNIGQFYWLELRIQGSSIKARAWSGSAANRPASWNIETTDGSFSAAGWNGFYNGKDDTRIDYFSVGIAGIEANPDNDDAEGSKSFFYDPDRAEADDFFNGGKVTFGSGNNDGFSAEIKDYESLTGKVIFWEPMPYAVAPGTDYEMWPGCDKTLATCRDTYDNVPNFRGEPHLPGQDVITQTPEYSEQTQ